MPANLRDHCISLNSKGTKPSLIYRNIIRGVIDDREIFRKSAKDVKKAYPIVKACQGSFSKFNSFLNISYYLLLLEFVFDLTKNYDSDAQTVFRNMCSEAAYQNKPKDVKKRKILSEASESNSQNEAFSIESFVDSPISTNTLTQADRNVFDSEIQYSHEEPVFDDEDNEDNETFINNYLLSVSNTPLSVITQANNLLFDNSFMQ